MTAWGLITLIGLAWLVLTLWLITLAARGRSLGPFRLRSRSHD